MSDRSAADFLPQRLNLSGLRDAARGCQGCELYRNATQTVFGEGLKRSDVMLVGEQPGDREDQSGRPFVGPAGRLLDKALEEAGIDRSLAYVTNVVKHFKWSRVGKRRIHKTPNADEIMACRPWLEAEIEVVKPRVLVMLGATAAKSILGPSFRVTKQRGEFFDSELGPSMTATVHPSSILRARTEDDRRRAYEAFTNDLRLAAAHLVS
ncbi:MAG: UdgX family uracil-DNA binding protein [Actinomycetota bacterium]